jgi:cell division protein FtsZ
MGKAMMGTGEADGEDRATQASEKAIANPLLDEISLRGAKGVLINITGGHDLTLFELDEAANRIREEVDPEANIIVGSTLDTTMDGKMRVSVVATGIDASDVRNELPVPRRSLAEPLRQKVAAEDAPAEAQEAAVAFTAAEPAVAAPAPVERSLFEELPDAENAAAEEQMEDIFTPRETYSAPAESAVEDDLPPPAYQPAAYRPEPIDASPEDFMAPRAPAPGTPSPEALARLRQAVQNNRPAQEAAPQPVAEEKPRFGINSLINRMTGHEPGQKSAPQPQPRAASAAPRVQPNVSAAQPQEQHDADQERIEIPAFLRRQAN